MSLLSFFTVAGDAQATGDAADRQLAQMNQADYAPGGRIYERIKAQRGEYAAEAAYRQVSQNLQSGATGDVELQISDEFKAGAKEGLKNALAVPGEVVGGVGDSASSVLWGIVKNIPWWVWVGLLVAGFVWMGGLSLLRGRLARA